jgi:hypothetical protein
VKKKVADGRRLAALCSFLPLGNPPEEIPNESDTYSHIFYIAISLIPDKFNKIKGKKNVL